MLPIPADAVLLVGHMANKVLTVKLPEGMMEALADAANASGVSRHAFARAVLEEAAHFAVVEPASCRSAVSILIQARLRHDVALERIRC